MGKVGPQIDALKALHEKETGIVKTLNQNISDIGFGKLELNTSANSIEQKVSRSDEEAKVMLDDASQITAGGALVNDVAKGAALKPTATEKIAYVESRMKDLKALKYRLAALIGDPNAVAAKKLGEAVQAIDDLLAEKQITDEAASKLMTKLNALRQVNIFIGLAPQQKMKTATERFAALKTELKDVPDDRHGQPRRGGSDLPDGNRDRPLHDGAVGRHLSTLTPMITRLRTTLATSA